MNPNASQIKLQMESDPSGRDMAAVALAAVSPELARFARDMFPAQVARKLDAAGWTWADVLRTNS
jgi:hypothetical protein